MSDRTINSGDASRAMDSDTGTPSVSDSAESTPPITEKQAEARRANGRRSRGPKTTAGKNSSRMNALRHGMWGRIPGAVLHGPLSEDPAAVQATVDAIIDDLADPLLHLLRNCIDHGIEPPEQRVEAKKPPAGRVQVTVRRQRDRVVQLLESYRTIDPQRIQVQSLDSQDCAKDRQIQASLAIRTFIFKDLNAARHQARPHSCDAADASRRYDRRDHDGHGMAAAFGARLSRRCGSQETRSQSRFRIDGQGPGLPNQG